MKWKKRWLCFLAVSLLVIGIAAPSSAGPQMNSFVKVKHVSGSWIREGQDDFMVQDMYELPDNTLVYGDYLSFSELTGDIQASHMYIYSTYLYEDKPWELISLARVHGTALGKEIDAWGKTILSFFPNDDGTVELTGSGRYQFPFRDCSPRVILQYEGTHYPETNYAEGTYEGVIFGSCE